MPTIQEYAKMASEVYQLNGGIPPVGWELIEYAKPPNRWGFCVAVYRNPTKKEIVISFKGTDEWIEHLGNAGLASGHMPPQLGDAETKVREVLTTHNSPIIASILAESAEEIMPPDFFLRFLTNITAAIIVLTQGDFATLKDLILELLNSQAKDIQHGFDKVSPKMQKAIEKIQNAVPDYKVCITGHSLGGCIAELCAARFNLEAVTFDSPGTKELISADPRYKQPNYSKITSYLAAPNIVNTLYGHVGTCHRVFIPYIEGNWTWTHAGKSLFASSARVTAYGLAIYGLAIFGDDTTAPVAGAVAAGGVSMVMGGISAASTFGILANSDDFRRQHYIHNIDKAINDAEHPPVLMISWPRLSEINWASFFTALRALVPLPSDSPGLRVMFDQNAMIEAQIARLDGYKESEEKSTGPGNNPNTPHSSSKLEELSVKKGTATSRNSDPNKLEKHCQNYFGTIFGFVEAEENIQFTSPPELLENSSENTNLLQKHKENNEFGSMLGISSIAIGASGIFYSRYRRYQKETAANTSHTNTFTNFFVESARNIINRDNHNYSTSQHQGNFFSRQGANAIIPVRLSHLARVGRFGVFATAVCTVSYGGWQLIKQNKQAKSHSSTERVEVRPGIT